MGWLSDYAENRYGELGDVDMTPNRKTALDRVREIVSHYLPADHIWHSGNADKTLDQLGIDSMDRVQLAIEISEAFGLPDGLDQRADLDSARKIAEWIDKFRDGADTIATALIAGMPEPRAWWDLTGDAVQAATMPELRGEEPTLDLATDYVCVPVELFEFVCAMLNHEYPDMHAKLRACRPLPDMERSR